MTKEDMIKVKEDMIKVLDILSNKELDEIQCYIYTLKGKRQEEKEKKYLNELKTFLNKAREDNVYFCLSEDGEAYSIYSNNIEIE